MHAVESLQLNEVAVLHMTMAYYYRQHMLVITLSLVRGNWTVKLYEQPWINNIENSKH